jgi:hypothetical protein
MISQIVTWIVLSFLAYCVYRLEKNVRLDDKRIDRIWNMIELEKELRGKLHRRLRQSEHKLRRRLNRLEGRREQNDKD